jgi:tetratricopeptide (TPR) repeat protein
VYRALVPQQPDRLDWRLLLTRLLWGLGQQDEAVAQAMILDEAVPHSAIDMQITSEAWLVLGLYQEASGDVSKAVNSFSMALKLDPQQILAYPQLEALYYRRGEVDQAQEVHKSLLGLQPERSLSNREVEPGWFLYGFHVKSWSIEEQPLLQLALFWRLPEGTVPTGDLWIRAGDHWIQVVEVFNLVLNPGFEQDEWTGMELPSRYTRPEWLNVYPGEELALMLHDGRLSKVLRQSAPGRMQVATQLSTLQIQEGECFLFDAWTGGNSQSRRLALYWRDSSRRIVSENYPITVDYGSHPYA